MTRLLLWCGLSLAVVRAPGQEAPALKDVFQDAFLIGAALNPGHYTERDAAGAALVKKHFNSITPENVMKWERIHPRPGEYAFEAADAFVAFGEKNGMHMVGHTLVWHSQTPAWVFQGPNGEPASREALLERIQDHIRTVVGRYKGKVKGWDVVNEALNEDGTLRQSPWMKIIGEDYIAKAFQWAHEADPEAELYYNDYSVENEAKRNGAVALIRKLQAKGLRVTGIGLQGHNKLDWPTPEQQDATIAAFGKLGLKVMITELDVDVLPPAMDYRGADVSQRAELRASLNPYTQGLPEEMQRRLAKQYGDLFQVYCKHRGTVTRVTFWGVTDRTSWLNNWPVRGRTAYPLLFDRDHQPKPAFAAVAGAGCAGR